MRILVTNDELWKEGLNSLIEIAESLGEVVVVAPKKTAVVLA